MGSTPAGRVSSERVQCFRNMGSHQVGGPAPPRGVARKCRSTMALRLPAGRATSQPFDFQHVGTLSSRWVEPRPRTFERLGTTTEPGAPRERGGEGVPGRDGRTAPRRARHFLRAAIKKTLAALGAGWSGEEHGATSAPFTLQSSPFTESAPRCVPSASGLACPCVGRARVCTVQ